MIPLLRAALIHMASSVLLDLEDEAAIPACIADLKLQADRLPLAAKALEWEIQAQQDPRARTRQRSAGYRAEMQELLHGPLPPLELVDRYERDAVVRRVNGSLAREIERGDADAEVRMAELRAILENTGPDAAESPWYLTSLSRPRLAEWLIRWSDEAFKEAQETPAGAPMSSDPSLDRNDGGELALLRDIQKRLHPRGNFKKGVAAQECSPIIPRSAS